MCHRSRRLRWRCPPPLHMGYMHFGGGRGHVTSASRHATVALGRPEVAEQAERLQLTGAGAARSSASRGRA